MFEHVEAVALGLYEVGVGMGGLGRFPAEAPRGGDDVAEETLLDRRSRHPHRFGIPVVEVEGEKETALGRLVQERVSLPQIEDQGFLYQERVACLYDLEGRLEVTEVGQTETYEIRPLSIQHLP